MPVGNSAVLSDCGKYRYLLRRVVDPLVRDTALFIMLNPSVADATVNDATIRRCIRFTKDWGYHILEVVNLFAFRSTDPKKLKTADDPVGPDNDKWIRKRAEKASVIVAAWGTHGVLLERDQAVKKILSDFENPIHCLGVTQDGHPKHPLRLSASLKPILLEGTEGG